MSVRRYAGPLIALVVVAMFAAACSKDSGSGTSDGSGSGYSYGSSSSASQSGSNSSSRGGYGTGGGAGGSASTKTVMVGSEQANFEGTKDVASAKSVDIEANTEDDGTHYFSPTVLTGKAGQRITVKLTNESSSVPHNFSVDGTNVNIDLDPGTTESVSVTFPTSGSLTFFCGYHRSSGMLGELKVG